jgi:hypothetical protein
MNYNQKAQQHEQSAAARRLELEAMKALLDETLEQLHITSNASPDYHLLHTLAGVYSTACDAIEECAKDHDGLALDYRAAELEHLAAAS